MKELEITDWEPLEIAEMIEEQIYSLVPNWKDCGSPQFHNQHSFSYQEDDDDSDDGIHHPFYYNSSHSSSHASLPAFMSSYQNNLNSAPNWLQQGLYSVISSSGIFFCKPLNFVRNATINFLNAEDLMGNDDASSVNSFKYSTMDYYSGNEDDYDLSFRGGEPLCISRITQKSTRFCPNYCNDEKVNSWRACSSKEQRKFSRIQSLVDVRSQLLHRSLVEEINKRRLFKTVGAVENIGFHEPGNHRSYGRSSNFRS